MRMYADLAPWFHLITDPADYAEEAAHIVRVIGAACTGPARTLLELGSGGGNMASHLKRHFACTLTDLSPDMIALSGGINPNCRHIVADMRSVRLGERFDIVLAHDAIGYMTTEEDLGGAIATAAAHVRPGGVAIFIPDEVAETFAPGTRHGGHDGADGRSVRYLEWAHELVAGATTYDLDYAFLIREGDGPVTVAHDRHTLGVFPRRTWMSLIRESGLRPVNVAVDDPHADEHVVFVARGTS